MYLRSTNCRRSMRSHALERFAECSRRTPQSPLSNQLSCAGVGVGTERRTLRPAVVEKRSCRKRDDAFWMHHGMFLNRLRDLDRLAVELSGGWEAELHVVVDGALPMSAVTHCLRRFADPEVPTCLRVDVEYQEGVIDRFDRGPADIGLYLGFDTDREKQGYECIDLPALEPLVAAPDHPLCHTRVTVESRSGHMLSLWLGIPPRFAQQTQRLIYWQSKCGVLGRLLLQENRVIGSGRLRLDPPSLYSHGPRRGTPSEFPGYGAKQLDLQPRSRHPQRGNTRARWPMPFHRIPPRLPQS